MILRIVDNNDHLFSASKALVPQLLEKLPAALSVEFLLFASVNKFSVTQSQGSEIPDAFACGRVPQDRFFDLRWNPHSAPRTVLLKVNLIQSPEVHVRLNGQLSKFFYAPLVEAD